MLRTPGKDCKNDISPEKVDGQPKVEVSAAASPFKTPAKEEG